jgi:hypothetical protein
MRNLLFALLAGCPAATTPSTSDAPTPPDLAGQWVSDCVPNGDGTAFALAFDLGSADWSLDYVVHGTESCDFPVLTVHIDGPYELVEPSAVVDGAWDAIFSFDHKTMEPEVDDLVAALDGAGCGADPWAVGVAQDVYADGCPAFGQYPQADCGQDYDLVSLADDTLRFGLRPADNDLCTPERRPTELSPLVLTRP